ncbi:MAG TPA: NUDIX hydrolase [Gammaproteobacteria bacterium]|nr:NUDIX hydrolase [Gammaproteobacteria bacterium]
MAQGIDVTVAAVIERDGRFLLVEELVSGRAVFNQPAGHLEPNESLIEAAIRETREETGHTFEPSHVVGIYQWHSPEAGTTFLRVAFCGPADAPAKPSPLDDGIIGFHWLTAAELKRRSRQLRSPMVLRCLDDYVAGVRYPLDVVAHITRAVTAQAAARA